jgi:nucleoside-diphosphate-sugar epimerase
MSVFIDYTAQRAEPFTGKNGLSVPRDKQVVRSRSIAVIGASGFIGGEVCRQLAKSTGVRLLPLHHERALEADLSDCSVVISCAIQPNYAKLSYRDLFDLDYSIAEMCSRHSSLFVMLSSRKVYGVSSELRVLTEDAPLNPSDFYSENKIITEERIRRLGSHHLILRGSNVFGYEPRRNSFLGFCMKQLVDFGHIKFDLNADIQRDFLPVERFSAAILKAIDFGITGTFNLGSGYGLPVREVAEGLIRGYGEGKLIEGGSRFHDQFVLCSRRLQVAISEDLFSVDFERVLARLGARLRAETCCP